MEETSCQQVGIQSPYMLTVSPLLTMGTHKHCFIQEFVRLEVKIIFQALFLSPLPIPFKVIIFGVANHLPGNFSFTHNNSELFLVTNLQMVKQA